MAVVLISSLIPNADELLALEVEELAGVLLVHLNSRPNQIMTVGVPRDGIYPGAFFRSLNQELQAYGPQHDKVLHALMEAWAWLVREAFLVSDTTRKESEFFLSRRAKRIASPEDFTLYRKASLLPKAQLHPLIAAEVYPTFLRGKYDTSIFQAFREIEVAVRTAGNFSPELVGDKLMRSAFASTKNGQAGPLTDGTLPAGEQEAMGHLFAGAFGLYRNSTAHRYVPTKAEEAAEVIMFASQLLRIVDRLKPQPIGGATL